MAIIGKEKTRGFRMVTSPPEEKVGRKTPMKHVVEVVFDQ